MVEKIKLKYWSNGVRTVNYYNESLIGSILNEEYGTVSCYGFAPINTKWIVFGAGNGDFLYEIDVTNEPWKVEEIL